MSNLPKKEVTIAELQDTAKELSNKFSYGDKTHSFTGKLRDGLVLTYNNKIPSLSIKNFIIKVNLTEIIDNDIIGKIIGCFYHANLVLNISNVTVKFRSEILNRERPLILDITKCLSCYMKHCDFSEMNINIKTKPRANDSIEMNMSIPQNIHIESSKFRELQIDYEGGINQGNKYYTAINNNAVKKNLTITHRQNLGSVDLSLFVSANLIDNFLILDLWNGGHNKNNGYYLSMLGDNKIRAIQVRGIYPQIVDWRLGESIGENILKTSRANKENKDTVDENDARLDIGANKKVFSKFKKMTINEGDRLQENTLNYHISKCDELLMETEKGFWQEKIIMGLGRELSTHGTSWVLPIIWIIIFNIYVALIIYAIIDVKYPTILSQLDVAYIWGQLCNPISQPLGIVQGINENLNYKTLQGSFIWISSLAIISKGFYAMCIYEFVRAARRFTIR